MHPCWYARLHLYTYEFMYAFMCVCGQLCVCVYIQSFPPVVFCWLRVHACARSLALARERARLSQYLSVGARAWVSARTSEKNKQYN